jgi:hypothetical protein
MSEFAPSYHEAGHAVAAQYFGLGMTHVSIRAAEDSLGRCSIQNGHTVDDLTAAVVMLAGQVAERMALGKDPRPNWFLDDDHDMDSARLFVQRACKDELEGRQLAQLKARALMSTKWEAVSTIAGELQRKTTLLGEDVERICRELGVTNHGSKPISKAEAMAKLTPRGRRAVLGTVAGDGKSIEKR